MITLTLLHPVQSSPVQSWTFDQEKVIRIGRAVDNHVVLYSAVVSRHHVELRRTGVLWEVINLGTNGTYLDGKRVHQAPLTDGGVIRLARSGPNIQVRMDHPHPTTVSGETPRIVPEINPDKATHVSDEAGEIAGDGEDNPDDDEEDDPADIPQEDIPFYVRGQHSLPLWHGGELTPTNCTHERAEEEGIFCIDCGQPLKTWQSIGDYQVIKYLGNNNNTYMAWRQGYSLVLKTLKPELTEWNEGIDLFEQRASVLSQLSYPGLPRVFEGFEVAGQPFLASEMIFGQNLQQWVTRRGPLSQVEAVAWILEVCQTLEYLHQQTPPVVHQGVKPTNLIRPTVPKTSHRILLVDLGDLKFITPEVGTVIGAVGYAAPEQQEGRALPVSDLYALGTTLVYLLTGLQPDTFYRWEADEFRLCVDDVPRLSPDMAKIVRRLTEPQPDQRYSSAAELTTVLAALI